MVERFLRSLVPCVSHDLTADVHDGEPDIVVLRDAVLMPKIDGSLDPVAGLYDRTGRRVSAADLLHHYPTVPKASFRPFLNRIDAPARCRRPAIYGGSLERHYGHFITECLNTLWCAAERARSDHVVAFNSTMTTDQIYAVPWIAAILDASGLQRDQVVSAKVPARFDMLTVPFPAFCEDGFVFRSYAAFCSRLGARLSEPTRHGQLIYFSRRAVVTGSMRMENERELEEHLQSFGAAVVRPEDLTVGQQIGLFRDENVVLGAIGSAFHTSIFSDWPRCVVCTPQPAVARSFPLMDASHATEIDYYQIAGNSPARTPTPGFNVVYRADDVVGTAEDLIELGRAKLVDRANPEVACILHPEALVPTALTTTFGERLGVSVGHDLLWAMSSGEHSSRAAVAFRAGRVLFVAHGDADLRISYDGDQAVWAFLVEERDDGTVLLRSLHSGRYLSVPPARENAPAHIRCTTADAWERFRVAPLPDPEAERARSGALIRRVLEFWRSDSIHAHLG